MIFRTARYGPEPLPKRIIAWILLFSFFLQCAPVAAWALPFPAEASTPSPMSPQDLIPGGLPVDVAPKLPGVRSNSLLEPDYLADVPEATPTPQPSVVEEESTPTEEAPKPRRYRVTPENLRAREEKRLEAERKAQTESAVEEEEEPSSRTARHSSHGQDPRGQQGQPEEEHAQPSTHHGDRHDDRDCNDDGLPGRFDTTQMAVVIPPSRLPGSPAAAISRLPHPESAYRAISATDPPYTNDYAVTFKKTYIDLRNPGSEQILWDFYSPVVQNNRTSRHTSASIQFRYQSKSRCASHKDASHLLEMKVYDNNSPHGRTIRLQELKSHLQQLEALGGLVTPDAGVWRWKESRNGQLLSDSTFEVKKQLAADATWTRRIEGNLQTIVAPFVAHISDEWLFHTQSYSLPSFEAGPGALAHFSVEWNWKAPKAKYNRNRNHVYLTVRSDYWSDGNNYRLITRAFDHAYRSKGRVIDQQEGTGWLPQTTVAYGEGLPITGPWQLQEKIDGVETELLTLQERQLLVGVQSPRVVYRDNEHQTYTMNMVSQPSTYQVKNFDWTLELRDAGTQDLVRSYTGTVSDNTKQALSWQQTWDGRDAEGNLVPLNSMVQAQLRLEVPQDDNEVVNNFQEAVEEHQRCQRNVPQHQIEPSRFKPGHNSTCPYRHHSSSGGQGGQGQGASGGAAAAAPSGRFWILSGPNPTVGITHRSQMVVTVGGSNVYTGPETSSDRWTDIPVIFTTPNHALPGLIGFLFRTITPNPTGPLGDGYFTACGEWSEIYLHSSDGAYSKRLIVSFDQVPPPPFPNFICFSGLFLTPPLPDRVVPQAVASTNPSPPIPVVTAAPMGIGSNRTTVGGSGPMNAGMIISSGLYEFAETDLSIRTKGLTAAVTRYWHSAGDGLTLGTVYPTGQNLLRSQFGWVWSFQRELNFSDNGNTCEVVNPEGGSDVFVRAVDGSWSAVRPDVTDRLRQIDDRHFEIETKGHTFTRFQYPDQQSSFQDLGARAFMVEQRDTHNNRLIYEWDARGSQLFRILDGNRSLLMTLSWGTGQVGVPDLWVQPIRITENILGRSVSYSYRAAPAPFNNQSFLSDVTLPGGVTEHFDYIERSTPKGNPGQITYPSVLLGSPERLAFYQTLANNELICQLRQISRNGVVQSTFANVDANGTILAETTEKELFTFQRGVAPASSPAPGGVRMNVSPLATPNDKRTFDYKLDSEGRPTDIWDTQGRRRQFAYDPAANLTSYISSLNEQSTFTYDAKRNLTEAKNALNEVSKFTYDNRDRLTRIQYPDPVSGFTNIQYSPQDDVIRVEDPTGSETLFSYTTFGALATMTNALGNVWTYNYNADGFLTSVVEPADSDGMQPVWGFQNDRAGRVVAESSQGTVTSRTRYDARDRVTDVTLLESNSSRVPASRNTHYDYNAFDQVTKVTNPLNQATSIEYDKYQRYLKTIRPDGSTLSRTYNAQGDVDSHTNANGARALYSYDTMHRLVQQSHPAGGGNESYAYDEKGRMTSYTKIDGSTVTYEYDKLNRPTNVLHRGTIQRSYTYDSLGRTATMTDPVGTTRYTYNQASDLLEVTDGQNRRIQYDYDRAHQLRSRTDPESLTMAYTRNERGQVTSATYDGLSAAYRYNPHGEVTRVQWTPTGMFEDYLYSSQGESLNRSVVFPGGVGSLESEAVTLDGLGRKTGATFTLPGGVRTLGYSYDVLGQLTRSQRTLQPGGATTTQTFTFDGNTNRTQINNQTSAYSGADRHTAISGLPTPTYNSIGAIQIDQFGSNFTHDYRDQVTTFARGATNAAYRYDGNNLRMQKVVNGATTQYLWDGGEVLKEYNGDGSVKASYFMALGRQAIKTNGQWYIYLTDTHGSNTGLVDLSGNRVATYENSAFGEPLVTLGSVYNPYRWNSEQLDAESGLVYLRNRYYQPSTGRFIQRDPIGYNGGLNLYQFAGGDPVNNSDPSGLEPSRNVAGFLRGAAIGGYATYYLVSAGVPGGVLVTVGIPLAAKGISDIYNAPDSDTAQERFFEMAGGAAAGGAAQRSWIPRSPGSLFTYKPGMMGEPSLQPIDEGTSFFSVTMLKGTIQASWSGHVEAQGENLVMSGTLIKGVRSGTDQLLRLDLGKGGMKAWINDVAKYFATTHPEAKTLTIKGIRAGWSSSANPGKTVNLRPIDLSRYRR